MPTFRRTTAGALCAATIALWPTLCVGFAGQAHAAAAPECFPTADVAKAVKDKLGMEPAGVGLTGEGNALIVYASPSGDWLSVMVSPKGVACPVASGTHWTQATAADQGPGA